MCQYCEDGKVILDTFPVELKIKKLGHLKDNEIVEKYYALSINEMAYQKINYCPMCGRELGG